MNNDFSLDPIKSAFVSAAYGKLTPSLMRFSADVTVSEIRAQIIVLDETNEEELETILEILGDMVGHLDGYTSDFEVIRIKSPRDVGEINPRLCLLYRSYASW